MYVLSFVLKVEDRLTQNYRPFLGQTCAKLSTLFRTKRTKTIPCPVAHPHMGHIRGYTPGPGYQFAVYKF